MRLIDADALIRDIEKYHLSDGKFQHLVEVQTTIEECKTGDLISRQAAIDAIVAWTVEDRPDVEMPTDLIDRIKALPSAQPEIVRCKDCVYHGGNECMNDVGLFIVGDNDFCSRAERRTDEADNRKE